MRFGGSDHVGETVRVLLIDSDAAACSAAAQGLAGCFHSEPLVISSMGGRAGTELLRAGHFDLVFADIGSLEDLAEPAEAMSRLIRVAGNALTIAVADADSVSVAVAALGAGAHDFIAKPIAGPLLAARIGTLAHRHGRPLPVTADIEGAILDRQAAVKPRPALQPEPQPILPMWRQEQRIIEEAVASFAGNIALAAAALQLSPSTIYRKRQAWAEMGEDRGAA